jgi:hypothetical protein
MPVVFRRATRELASYEVAGLADLIILSREGQRNSPAARRLLLNAVAVSENF